MIIEIRVTNYFWQRICSMTVLGPTEFAVVVSITASNENVGCPWGAIMSYVFEHGDNPDIVFPWLAIGYHEQVHREVQERPVWILQFFPIWDPVCREILDSERGWRIGERRVVGVTVQGFYMGEERCDRPGSSCALPALRHERIVQLCSTPWGLGWHCWMAERGGRRRWQKKSRSCWWGHCQRRYLWGLWSLEQDAAQMEVHPRRSTRPLRSHSYPQWSHPSQNTMHAALDHVVCAVRDPAPNDMWVAHRLAHMTRWAISDPTGENSYLEGSPSIPSSSSRARSSNKCTSPLWYCIRVVDVL